MIESEWLSCADPLRLLEFVRARASPRKLRLLAVACLRRIWDRIDVLGRGAIEVAEAFADGRADAVQLRAARLACKSAGDNNAWYAAASDPFIAARNSMLSVQSVATLCDEKPAQAQLVRDIFGDLFHPVTFGIAWRTANVVDSFRAVYEDKAFARMPILADALMEVGCADERILSHFRQDGDHVRGCWVVDLILATE